MCQDFDLKSRTLLEGSPMCVKPLKFRKKWEVWLLSVVLLCRYCEVGFCYKLLYPYLYQESCCETVCQSVCPTENEGTLKVVMYYMYGISGAFNFNVLE